LNPVGISLFIKHAPRKKPAASMKLTLTGRKLVI